MKLLKDQTASLAFECASVAIAVHVTFGMDVVMKYVVDVEGDLNLQDAIDHVEGMESDMEAQEVVDFE